MKKNYTVYFEFFGKKMKTVVYAANEIEARKMVVDKIIFNKIEAAKSSDDSFEKAMDIMKDIFKGI